MAKADKYRLSATRSNATVCRLMAAAEHTGTMLRTAGRYEGRRIELDGRMLLNFGTCSYMALDKRSELRDAAVQAAHDFGTQFSISRAYLECPLYRELEFILQEMVQRPVVVTPSTTLAHMAALPTIVRDEDAVVIDQFAHASLHTAARLLRDVPVHLVRHSRLDLLEQLLAELSVRHARIWLVIDGLYSMFGDFAPFEELARMLERWPQLHLYVDDAHATGWLGIHGRGGALTQFGAHDRVTVALSLNKSFAAAGAALALPDEETKLRIRRCGGPLLFSGPIQPPMLGAALASAQLHMSAGHSRAQAELLRRIDYARTAADRAGLDLASNYRTPIFFVRRDSVDQATSDVQWLMKRGFYVCASAFPAVPMNLPGIRFTITLHTEQTDIDALIGALAETTSERPIIRHGLGGGS
jgi:7-keto-8-aminopelargonate synthetase-like enzyme